MLAWLDEAAAAYAAQVADTPRMVTKHISGLTFQKPARPGQIIKIYGEVCKVGKTSLTLAILPMTVAGVGVGWLPDSLVAADLASGLLTDLRDALPDCELSVMAIQLRDSESIFKSEVWETVAAYIDHR